MEAEEYTAIMHDEGKMREENDPPWTLAGLISIPIGILLGIIALPFVMIRCFITGREPDDLSC